MKKKFNVVSLYLFISIWTWCSISCGAQKEQTTDLAMHNLAGEVASCKTTSSLCTVQNGEIVKDADENNTSISVLRFSKEGLLTQFGDIPLNYDAKGVFIPDEKIDRLTRNEKGQLVELSYAEKDEDGYSDIYEFQYNENGVLSFQILIGAHSCWENKYVYNTSGQIIEEIAADGYDGLRRETKYTYEYKKADQHKNWTIRLAHDVTNGQYYYEEREIQYY